MPARVLVPLAIGGPPLPPSAARCSIETLAGPTMGTTWRVRVVTEAHSRSGHQSAVERLLDTLIDDLSNWEPDSALSRFNRVPLGTWQALPSALVDVLDAAAQVHRESDGAFDPTVARAVSAWGFGPTLGDASTAAGAARFDAIELDVAGRRARRHADVSLDLCGIAKGYAVDRVSRLLVERGAPHHLVEIGGELRGSGVKPDALPWWVDLESPPGAFATDEAPTVAALHGLSIATSGDHVRYVEEAGRRHAHTIDPRTGAPVVDAPASVTVLHADCMRADAEATAITVLGRERGLAHANRQGLAARIIERTPHGLTAYHSAVFDAMLG